MADSDSILQLGIEAARAGDKAEARELFRLVTREAPNNAQGWLWLAGVAEDREEKRAALERVVTIEPANDLARKGLAAIGGPRGSTPAVAHDAVTLPVPPATTPAVPPAVDDPDAGPDTQGASSGARQYTVPDTAAPAAVTVDGWTTPTIDPEEFDLQDYQQPPQSPQSSQIPPVALDPQAGAGTRIVVEDEEPAAGRRLGWLPIAALVVVSLLAAFWWGTRTPGGAVQGTTSTAQPSSATTGSDIGALPITELPATTAAPAAGGEQTVQATAPPAEGTTPPPEATAPPAEVAAPPAETPPASAEETIVVVAPGAEVVPTPEAPVETPPAEQPPAAPAPAPPGDLAAANPAILPIETIIEAGSWTFSYGGIQNVTDRAYAGSPPSRGQYQIVLMAVGNRGDAAASIPDGFFVLKDAQGRVYDFNRAASTEYFIAAGGAGNAADIGADAQVPNNNVLTSVPLLFDVPPDAANLVLLSRDNLNQGFVIR